MQGQAKSRGVKLPMLGCLGLALVLHGGCSHGPDTPASTPAASESVTGTVAYRERMALPPDAVVEVSLLDVSRADAPAETVADSTIRAEGRQVPIPFGLSFDPKRIDERHSYVVRATIRSEGRILFTTDTAYEVITCGNPRNADLVLVRVSDDTSGLLLGTSWKLEDLAGAEVIKNVEATLDFFERGKVGGKGSCNRFTGSTTISGSKISIGPLVSTQMACLDAAVGDQEKRYLAALQGAESFTVQGTTLEIRSKDLAAPLRFVRTKP
ncbi:MAG: YbaY family lipoprotein [Candidatus Eiseniibacteriota bacterium]